jgi:hypothetical protein
MKQEELRREGDGQPGQGYALPISERLRTARHLPNNSARNLPVYDVLHAAGDGTRVFFEHFGFDVSQPWGKQLLRGAEVGWERPVCCILFGGTLTVFVRLNKVLDPKIVDSPAE